MLYAAVNLKLFVIVLQNYLFHEFHCIGQMLYSLSFVGLGPLLPALHKRIYSLIMSLTFSLYNALMCPSK